METIHVKVQLIKKVFQKTVKKNPQWHKQRKENLKNISKMPILTVKEVTL
jgi:hypothetical protein